MKGDSVYPLDSRYSWLVAVVSSLVYSVSPGMLRTIGIILVEMEEYHDWINADLSLWMSCLPFTLMLLAGSFTGFLLTKLELRTVVCLGLSLTTSGYVMVAYGSSFALHIIAFFVMGVGFNFSFIASIVSVSSYFEKKRATALGLTSAGAGIGTFLIPPLSRLLFDKLSYQEAVVFIGMLGLQMCVPAMFIRPLSYWKYGKEKGKKTADDVKFTHTNQAFSTENAVNCEHEEKGDGSPCSSSHSDIVSSTQDISSLTEARVVIESESVAADSETKKEEIGLGSDDITTRETDNTELEATANTSGIQTPADRSASHSVSEEQITTAAVIEQEAPTFRQTLSVLLCSKAYILILLACSLTSIGYASIFVLLPVHAQQLGIPKYHVSYALSVYGAVEIPARVLHGALANRKYISALTHLGISLVVAGLGILLIAVWQVIAAFYITCIFCGIFFACLMAFVPVIVLERFEQKYSSVAVGICYGCEGMTIPISYGLAPYLFHVYGTWGASLLLASISVCSGGCIMMVTSCIFPIATRVNCRLRSAKQQDVDNKEL